MAARNWKSRNPTGKPGIHLILWTGSGVVPQDGNGSDGPSVHTWVEAWAARNGWKSDPSTGEAYAEVTSEVWWDCDDSVEVELLTVHGRDHSWLGLEWVWQEGRYDVTATATDAIWEFFASHPKRTEGLARRAANQSCSWLSFRRRCSSVMPIAH